MNPGVIITLGLSLLSGANSEQVNHANIFQYEGLNTAFLPYYDKANHKVNVAALKDAISDLPDYSIVVLQVCGNNPTGCDLTSSERSDLAGFIVERSHFAFLDVAYMRFVTGDVEIDCAPIHLFAEHGLLSFSSRHVWQVLRTLRRASWSSLHYCT